MLNYASALNFFYPFWAQARLVRRIFEQPALKLIFQQAVNPEQYRKNLIESVGAQNMDKLPAIPRDDFHLFVKSQVQRLAKAPGQMAVPPEKLYFDTRKEALKTALKLHEKNCEKALGIQRKDSPPDDGRTEENNRG